MLQPPMFPGKLFREMVLEALVAQPQEQQDGPASQDPAAYSPSYAKAASAIKDKRMVAPKRFRGDWSVVGREMYDTYGPPEKYNIEPHL